MLEIVLASSNKSKIAEFSELIQVLDKVKLVPQSEFDVTSVVESGGTFIENAILKARHAAAISGLPAIADDSGLCVEALDGAPGVLSARYAGDNASDQDRIQKLISDMQDVPEDDRVAHFHSVVALLQHEDDPAPLICHGIWEGEILTLPRGSQGFGYDPIFYVPSHDCSAAELGPDEKNRISHRGQAMNELLDILQEVLL